MPRWERPSLSRLRAQAERLADAGNFDEAVALYRQIAAAQPDVPDARVQLAVLLRRQGRPVQAMAADAEAAMIWARCGEIDVAFQLVEPLVDWLLAGRDPRAAVWRLEKILAHGPAHPGVHQKLAMAYRVMGRGRAVDC
jgi:Flp pilus assembly protein TadD